MVIHPLASKCKSSSAEREKRLGLGSQCNKFSVFLDLFRWAMHEKVLKPLRKNAKHIHNWWEFTGRPDPGEEAILETLKRLVSGVLTHPVTIGE